MRTGELKHLISVEQRGTAKDAHGQPVESWEPVLPQVYASVRPAGGNERVRAMQMGVELSHVVTVRYREEFNDPLQMAARRIRFGERLLGITASRNLDEGNLWIVMDCIEGPINGQ